MAGLTDAQGSRVFHLMMIIPAALLLLLSLVSLSTLAVTNKKFSDGYRGTPCILYAGTEGGQYMANGGGECTYSIVAGGILGLLALVLAGVLVAKAIMGIVA